MTFFCNKLDKHLWLDKLLSCLVVNDVNWMCWVVRLHVYQCTIFCNDIPQRINVKEKICRKKIVLLYSFVNSLYISTITFTIRKLFNIECYFSKNSTNIIILDRICEMKNDVIIISEVNSLNKLTIVRKRGSSSLMVWVHKVKE